MTDGPIRWASVSKWELDTAESAADPFRCERDGGAIGESRQGIRNENEGRIVNGWKR